MIVEYFDSEASIYFEEIGTLSRYTFTSHRDSPTQPGYLMLDARSYLDSQKWAEKIDPTADDAFKRDDLSFVLDDSGLADTMISQYLIEMMRNESSIFGSRSGTIVAGLQDKDGNPMVIPHGVTALYGAQGTGKSSLAFALHEKLGDKSSFISFGEPDLISTSNMGAIAKLLNTSLFSMGKEVVFLDSARSFLFSPSSSTGAGGVNNEIFVMLSKISSSLAKLERSLVLTFNPMSLDKDVLEATLDGSVSAIIRSDLGNGFSMRSRFKNERKAVFFSFGHEQAEVEPGGINQLLKETSPVQTRVKNVNVLNRINKFLLGE